jgi:hypothetical protein
LTNIKTLPILKISWIAVSTILAVWFLYWVYYDVSVWSKPLAQVQPVNYVGLIVSVALAIVGTQLGKIGVFKRLLPPSEQKQKVPKELRRKPQPTKRKTQPIERTQESQPTAQEETKETTQTEESLQVPPGASVPPGCKFFIGYLHARPESTDIPEKCLECEHVVECMSPTSGTTNEHTSETD